MQLTGTISPGYMKCFRHGLVQVEASPPPPPPQPDPPQVKDGYEAPPLSHRDGPDTEREAAEKLKPTAKVLRQKALDFALARGTHGVTGWELCVEWGYQDRQSSARARLTELAQEKHGNVLTKSSRRRPNANGNNEVVYVATTHYTGD